MAKGRVSGGTPLNMKASLDVNEAKKNALDLIKTLNELRIAGSSAVKASTVGTGMVKVFDSKALTEYQAGLLKIKQEALDLSRQNSADKKAKQEQVAANRAATIATQNAIKEETRLKKEQLAIQKQAGIGTVKAFDNKPLSDYQAGLLKIKQEALDLAKKKKEDADAERKAKQDQIALDKAAAKAKQDQAAAERSASLATQAALKEETRIRKEQIAIQKQAAAESVKKKPISITSDLDSNQKYINSTVRMESAINAERVARAQLNTEKAKAAIANNALINSDNIIIGTSKQNTAATNENKLSKRQLAEQAKILAIQLAAEKLRLAENTAAIKNNAREQLNAKGSLEQRRAALIRLIAVYDRLSKAERESASGARMANIIKGVTDQIKELEAATGRSQRKVGSYTESIAAFFSTIKNNILSTLGPIALITAAWAAAKAAFNHNVEISDNFVDVQRTAKLSADEVDRLGDKLKNINTRTNLEGLLDIGFEGGRLGVQKEELVDFIQTVDKLAVVLKKELPGGAAAVSESLGKIAIVYKIAENEGITLAQAMNKVASSQLELAHSGPVTVKYLQDFTLGLAGTAVTAKLSLPVIEAYGAVLGGAGQIASSASLALTRVVNDLSIKREKYFAIAQLADATLTIEKFTNLINTDTKAALDLFFKGLKAGNPAQTELADRLNTVGLRTGKVSNAVKILAKDHELLATKVGIGTKAYEKADSVNHNFELSNNSLAASFDKIKNSIANYFTSASNGRVLAELLNAMTDNRTEAEKLADAYEENKHRADELTHTLDPLVKRYDELKTKGKLNRDEQTELRDIILKIAEILPDSATALNKYGEALDINTGKVREFTKAQKDSLELQNREALRKANKEFEDADAFLKTAVKIQEGTNKAKKDWLNSIMDLGGGNSVDRIKQKAKDDVTETLDIAYRAAVAVRKLNGVLTKSQQDIISKFEKPIVKPTEKSEITGTGEIIDDPDKVMDIAAIKKEIKDLTAANVKLSNVSVEFQKNVKRIRELKEQLREAAGGKAPGSGISENSGVSSRNALQREIDDAIAASKRKQLSADDADVQAVEDKYAKIREKVKQHYEKLAKQEKSGKLDPTKKENLNVRLSGLDTAEINEKQAVIDKQSNERFKVQLADQAKDFEEFENYKLKYGTEAAQKRYNVDYTTAEAYAQKLEDLQTNILNKYGDPSGYTEAQKQELGIVTDQIIAFNDKRKSLNDKYYDDAVQAAMTATQAIKAIDNDYQRDLKAFGDTATDEQISNLNRRRDVAIQNITEENAFASSGYAELMSNMDAMTRQQVIEKLNIIKAGYLKEYTVGKEINGKIVKLTAAQFTSLTGQVNQQIDNLNGNNVFNKIGSSITNYRNKLKAFPKDSIEVKTSQREMFKEIAEGAQAAATGLSGIGEIFEDLGIGGEKLQVVLGQVSGILEGAGGIANGIKNADPVAIVSGSIKLLSSAIDIFNSKDRKLNRKIEVYKEQLDSLGRAYAKLERDVNNSVGESYYTDSAKQIENLKQQEAELIKARDAEASKKKSDKSKVEEYNNAIAEIPNKIEDINRAVSQMLLQSNFKEFSQNLSDALVSAFETGENSIDAMNDTFDKFIKKAVANSIQLKVIQPIIDDMMKEAGDYAKGNDNSILGFDFNKWRDLLTGVTNKSTQLLEEAYNGLGLEKGDGPKSSSLQKGIKSITSDQASALEGLGRGQYDQQKKLVLSSGQQVTVLTGISKTLGDFYQLAKNNFDVAVRIEANTANTVVELKNAVTELKGINKNTSSNGSSYRGAGFG